MAVYLSIGCPPELAVEVLDVKVYLSIERRVAVNETAERLMDLAEVHIRSAGYGGFSFRDLAAEIGIKSASVHHHFPTKAMMAAAVARRYGDRFFAAVARPPSETAEDAIAAYRSAFKAALDRDGLMCLFGVLGAEAGGLCPEISDEILSFFRRCIEDLTQRIGGTDGEARAFQVIATLEGGMMLARAYQDREAFDQAVGGLV
jgi:TetR/AcrR family transcriptional regulator, transcriptional repressor for nem operon